MKIKITAAIIFFFLLSPVVWCQGRLVKTTSPCNDELLKKTPGRWMPMGHRFYANITKPQEQEIVNRLTMIHQLAFNVLPAPIAFDALPFFSSSSDYRFASLLTINRSSSRPEAHLTSGIPIIGYGYSAAFCPYFCGQNTYEMFRGAGCEAGTYISVTINNLTSLFIPQHLEPDHAGIMRINERPIKMMVPLRQKKWKGYDIYIPESGSGKNMVLLTHNGLLPFLPVTRREYLTRCLEYLPQFFDRDMIPFEKREGLALLMNKEQWDEQMGKMRKIKTDVIKHYKDEWEASSRAGLLDTPAIILNDISPITTSSPIFISQEEGGSLLVTENPAYIKKELPLYIPQFMIFSWWDCQCGPDPSLNPYKKYEEDFPIEKLQALIGK